ncbi:MAG: N-formylglutamate amidohydrolase, partial [Candidatus Woesearchaeota archaeon]|nr:N-formylglutamate amidohydrolase [Candidatus Woesearchaeota archaeon]
MRLIEPEVKGGLGVPLIVVTTQSSSHIPPEFERRVALRDDEVQRFTALHTEELYNGVLELGGVLVPAPVSRFLVQLNAKIQSTDQGLEYDRKKRYGAFLRESWTGNKVMDPTLTDKDEADIFVSVYAPFIDCITKLVAQAQKTWGYSILVEGLSFPAASVKRKRRNADIFLGTRDFTTASSYLITKTLETLAGLKYKTGVDNYGWNGG